MRYELRIIDESLVRQVLDFIANLDDDVVLCGDCGVEYTCLCHPDCPGFGRGETPGQSGVT